MLSLILDNIGGIYLISCKALIILPVMPRDSRVY